MSTRLKAVRGIQRVLRPLGLTVSRVDQTTAARRARFMRQNQISVVLDVGAHVGDYARELRQWGYQGRIESFEPLKRAYLEMARRSSGDLRWACHNVALGDANSEVTLNVAGNELSSSLLRMDAIHQKAAPGSEYVGAVEVPLRRIDDMNLLTAADCAWLKLDVQGFEDKVLAGCSSSWSAIRVIEIELSLVSLYEGAPSYLDLMARLSLEGFVPIWMERVFSDVETGHLMQVDAIFRRR